MVPKASRKSCTEWSLLVYQLEQGPPVREVAFLRVPYRQFLICLGTVGNRDVCCTPDPLSIPDQDTGTLQHPKYVIIHLDGRLDWTLQST